MDRALFAAATGMAAQQRNLDTIADNLANAEVVGFKGSAQTFGELVAPGEPGIGTVALGARVLFNQGKLARSPGPFDLAIDGPGFFTLTDSHGRLRYSRNGEFSRAADGSLRTAQDLALSGVRIPADALSASVSADGAVEITSAAGTRVVGRVRLAEFPAPEAMRDTGGSVFAATSEAGRRHDVVPGSDDGPKLRFGMLEQSNVTIIDAMMQILTAQRAYEANAKGVQAADEMLRIANNLQRG
ncbi:MAG: flagellar hook basal-body protein [Candidatus Eremiobacteraeota bacterium]|nr:flagellar hook basal-body protein [Candidatus Eremiobacteraeota bacterium]MBV8498178.1 flagellar hook basal-body protein [Candidatus Eremiobacteraeota bacterium]